MRFQSALALTAATVIIAAPFDAAELEQRQASAVQAALGPVMASLQALDTSILLLTLDPSTAPPMLAASDAAVQAMGGATSAISEAMPMGMMGAKSLKESVGGLVGMVQQTMGDLEAKKPVLDMLGVTPAAISAVAQNKAAADGLSSAIMSKLPMLAMSTAKQNAAAIDASMSNGMAALSARSLATISAAADLVSRGTSTFSAIGAEPAGRLSTLLAAEDEVSGEASKKALRQIEYLA